MDFAVWIMIMEALMELFQQLQQNKDEETLLARMDRPGFHEYRVVRQSLRAQGLRGKELREATRAALQESVAMSLEDRVAFLAEAREWEPEVGEPVEEG